MALPTIGANAYPYADTVGPIGGILGLDGRPIDMACETGSEKTPEAVTLAFKPLYYHPHRYDLASHFAEPTSESALRSALASAKAGNIIWVPSDFSVANSMTVPAGVIIASNRGLNGAAGAQIKFTHSNGDGTLFWAKSDSVFSGLRLRGNKGLGSQGATERNHGIRGFIQNGNGAQRVEVENCEISHFENYGVAFEGGGMALADWNNDAVRNRVHHCFIHNIQRHGLGYGIMAERGQGRSGYMAFLSEANVFKSCRHHVMGQAGNTSYEVRYCKFFEAMYNTSDSGNGTWYYQHQVDIHGAEGGDDYGNWYDDVHHCSFYDTSSSKCNVAIRGYPQGFYKVHQCYTTKLAEAGDNGLIGWAVLPYGSPTATSRSAWRKVEAYDNQLGGSEPEGDGPPVEPRQLSVSVMVTERN